jgi:hypothetical protein
MIIKNKYSLKLFKFSFIILFIQGINIEGINCENKNFDEIISLPNLTFTPNFKQYSGF